MVLCGVLCTFKEWSSNFPLSEELWRHKYWSITDQNHSFKKELKFSANCASLAIAYLFRQPTASFHLVCERTVLWQYPKCAKEEEITQQAWSTDLYFILKSTTVCGYNFRYCTVTITECRSTAFTPRFCHGRHTGGMTSSSYWFAHLYHYLTHHINSPALEMRVHSKSC